MRRFGRVNGSSSSSVDGSFPFPFEIGSRFGLELGDDERGAVSTKSQMRYGVELLVEGWEHSNINLWFGKGDAAKRRVCRMSRIRSWMRLEVGVMGRRSRVEKLERMAMMILEHLLVFDFQSPT